LAEVCQELLKISQIFEADVYDYEGIPSHPSSRSSSPTGEDQKKEELKEEIKFEANKAQNYLTQITKLTTELDNKDLEIKEFKTAIRQLKKTVQKNGRDNSNDYETIDGDGIEFIKNFLARIEKEDSESESSSGEESDSESSSSDRTTPYFPGSDSESEEEDNTDKTD